MGELKYCFGISCDKVPFSWSFGFGLSHMGKETYIYINFYHWMISIGRLAKFVEDDDGKK